MMKTLSLGIADSQKALNNSLHNMHKKARSVGGRKTNEELWGCEAR